MSALPDFVMWAGTFAVAAAVMLLKERLFPGKSAEESGYIPDSESPPWGWPATIAATICVAGAVCLVIWAGVVVGL